MNRELQDSLFKKYPNIFAEKDLPCTETCMCWGFQCGDGWYYLIDKLCSDIQKHIEEVQQKDCDTGGFIQQLRCIGVKEKRGTLRFQVDVCDDYIHNLIVEAEAESAKVCEICGSRENVSQTEGWIKTLCERCLKEDE